MPRSPYVLLAAAGALALAGCNPFRSPFKQAPVVQVSTSDANANARWSATLASPASLVGAVQMQGSAAMTPGSSPGNTHVTLDLSNASPGGVHPWQLRHGQCGQDSGPFGTSTAYKSLTVGPEGRGSSSVTVPLAMPTDGRYYVSVSASAANPETIVACGNLAAPTR